MLDGQEPQRDSLATPYFLMLLLLSVFVPIRAVSYCLEAWNRQLNV